MLNLDHKWRAGLKILLLKSTKHATAHPAITCPHAAQIHFPGKWPPDYQTPWISGHADRGGGNFERLQ